MARTNRGTRRSTIWVDTIDTITMASGISGSKLSLLNNLDADARRGATLTRMIMCYSFFPTIIANESGDQMLDIGVGVASKEAFDAGALSEPESEQEHPMTGWVYRCRHVAGNRADLGYNGRIDVQRDIRAQRKLDTGDLFMVTSNTALSGTASSMRMVFIIRCLLKLP